MRFLANENFPGAAIAAIREAGHEVEWVRIAAPGMSDPDVLAWAARDERILLTFDKDFGELARASALPGSCGIVLFRVPMPSPALAPSYASSTGGLASTTETSICRSGMFQ
jgi:predicted nuclease of predicted toxin-antitoxin system